MEPSSERKTKLTTLKEVKLVKNIGYAFSILWDMLMTIAKMSLAMLVACVMILAYMKAVELRNNGIVEFEAEIQIQQEPKKEVPTVIIL
jgi:hypothetical protein